MISAFGPAVELESKSVKGRPTVYNGTILFLQGLDVADHLDDVVDQAFADFIQLNPKGTERSGHDPQELTVVPLGGNRSFCLAVGAVWLAF
jgi:hypothetical protein